MKGRFDAEDLKLMISSAAHELRNQLGVMRNSLYFLKLVLPKEESLRRHLRIMEHQLNVCDRIVFELQSFARGNKPIIELTNLNQLVRETIESFYFPEEIKVKMSLSDDLPFIPLDPYQMRQVILNLISNAVQAMPDGGELRIRTYKANSRRVILEVEDTGPGVPNEMKESIFRPFFTTKPRGIGLGLYVCRKIVEMHGGEIECEDGEEGGALFRIKLPISGEGRLNEDFGG